MLGHCVIMDHGIQKTNALLKELMDEEESLSACEKAAMRLREAEKTHTAIKEALQTYTTTKKTLAVEKVTGIDCYTQPYRPKDPELYKLMSKHINAKIQELTAGEKVRRKALNKANKQLWKAIDDEVTNIGIHHPKPSKTIGQRFSDFVAAVTTRRHRPQYNPNMNFDEQYELYVDFDKDLTAKYSDAKRNMQWYKEEKRRLKDGIPELLCIEIPTEFKTDDEKLAYLGWKAKNFKKEKKRVKKERAIQEKKYEEVIWTLWLLKTTCLYVHRLQGV